MEKKKKKEKKPHPNWPSLSVGFATMDLTNCVSTFFKEKKKKPTNPCIEYVHFFFLVITPKQYSRTTIYVALTSYQAL
jgi:hypothetical protein